MNAIGIDHNLDRARIKKLLTIGLFASILTGIERIQGRLLLAGAEDDAVWDTCRAIRRMQKRLEETGSGCRCEALIYQHCSHFIFPESLLRLFLPTFVVDWILPLVFRETGDMSGNAGKAGSISTGISVK